MNVVLKKIIKRTKLKSIHEYAMCDYFQMIRPKQFPCVKCECSMFDTGYCSYRFFLHKIK